ncbi:uncharacterized protein LOC116417097 [Nasonia vitripennis]|uniref:Uncharacterized protein n=1 Tax=Nasonia vitripennis TaxID=7425 RepID=A0A7M7T992_NASVI|nr:uncharacterized protein LOC116417097 [Nasonia vitripennis]
MIDGPRKTFLLDQRSGRLQNLNSSSDAEIKKHSNETQDQSSSSLETHNSTREEDMHSSDPGVPSFNLHPEIFYHNNGENDIHNANQNHEDNPVNISQESRPSFDQAISYNLPKKLLFCLNKVLAHIIISEVETMNRDKLEHRLM